MGIETLTSFINRGVDRRAATEVGVGARGSRDPFAPNYELILRGGEGAPPVAISDRDNSSVRQFIDEIIYEDNADQFDKLTIIMRGQVDDHGGGDINSIVDSKLFAEGTIIECRFGYGNSLHTVGAARLVSVTPTYPSDDAPTLTLVGYDMLHKASRRVPKGGVNYKTFRDSQIASIIGSRNGYDIKVTDPSSFSGIRKTKGIFDRVQKKGVNDYVFLKKVAEINGFDLFSKFDPIRKKFALYFQPPLIESNREVFKFVYNSGDHSYQNSLINFKPTLDASDQATDFEIFVLVNKEKGGSSFKPIDRFDFDAQKRLRSIKDNRFTGGNVGARGGKKTPDSDGIQVAFKAFGRSFRFPPHKRFKNEAEARKSIEVFIRRQKENFITGDGSLIGVEVLQSRQIHEFIGLGEQFSGKYYLTKCKHIMSRTGGYHTEFSARKTITDVVVQAPPAFNLTENDKNFRKLKGI